MCRLRWLTFFWPTLYVSVCILFLTVPEQKDVMNGYCAPHMLTGSDLYQ